MEINQYVLKDNNYCYDKICLKHNKLFGVQFNTI